MASQTPPDAAVAEAQSSDTAILAPEHRQKLCTRCQRINFDSLFECQYENTWYFPAFDSSVRGVDLRSLVNSCPFCNLLENTFGVREMLKTTHGRLSLRRHFSHGVWGGTWNSIDAMLLTVAVDKYDFPEIMRNSKVKASNIYLALQSKRAPFVRVLQPTVSFELVNGWLNVCRTKHTATSCCLRPSDRVSLESITNFRLVDCETHSIVLGDRQPYAALSYVWGASSGNGNPHISPGTLDFPVLPSTIRDAMAVAKGLGLRYIWIDRYCIDQQDESEVYDQTSKMDVIYRNADITIIAAAGKDVNDGLPGIQPRESGIQPIAKVAGHLLVSTMMEPGRLISASKWNTRGWTYQEGILSRRRIVFTENQVYFECGGMYCRESLDLSLSTLHTPDGKGFEAQYHDGFNVGIFPKEIGQRPLELPNRLDDYTKRDFSNPNDILKGFMGVFGVFEQSVGAACHFVGVPILPPDSRGSTESDSEWSPIRAFCMGLTWELQMPGEVHARRKGFPSWSWTGWFGATNTAFMTYNTYDTRWKQHPDFQLRIRLKDGSTRPFNECYPELHRLSIQLPPVLYITAMVAPLKFRYVNPVGDYGYWAFSVRRGTGNTWSVLSPVVRQDYAFEDSGHLIAIHLLEEFLDDERPPRIYALIAYKRKGEKEFERVASTANFPKDAVMSLKRFKLR